MTYTEANRNAGVTIVIIRRLYVFHVLFAAKSGYIIFKINVFHL